VLEFVDGETLSARLAGGPLSVRESIDICGQIASALEAAHEGGIVHRDLKPGNVMITPAGAVKVLDFGLAKGNASGSGSSFDLTTSPTMAMTATGQGIILGTASYMSPEQARGKPVDRRADVWAFGCVLYECLTGRKVFPGDTASDVIARILEREPDWSALPVSIPVRLRDVVRRCLTKDPNERPRDIGDLRRELSAILLDMSSPSGIRAATTDVPSLAVLYFENLANDPESEYFCAGITEDIVTDLSKIKGLRVASRNAVARYRGKAVDIAAVGADLGVRAVLEGSVRRAGDRVRISAQLVNAADGFHLWAERYDRTLQDVFAVQEEIASSIAQALRVALSPAEVESLAHDKPSDVRAYDLYLKGREQYGKYSPESLQAALELFRQAIAVDADYALAWAGVADCYGQLMILRPEGERAEMTRLGLEAARRAIAINPKLAEAHKAEALVLLYSGDVEGHRAAVARALQVNPRFTPAIVNSGVDRFNFGDVAGAERMMRRALEVEPQGAFQLTWLASILIITGRAQLIPPLIEPLKELADNPFYVSAYYTLNVWTRGLLGDLDGARRFLQEAEGKNFSPGNLQAVRAWMALREGRMGDVAGLLPPAEAADRMMPGNAMLAATAALKIGQPELAASYMRGQMRERFGRMLTRLEPPLHPLLDAGSRTAPEAALLMWPLEAPMLSPEVFAQFREVRIASGRPETSELRSA
jgi:TolB-like protein